MVYCLVLKLKTISFPCGLLIRFISFKMVIGIAAVQFLKGFKFKRNTSFTLLLCSDDSMVVAESHFFHSNNGLLIVKLLRKSNKTKYLLKSPLVSPVS